MFWRMIPFFCLGFCVRGVAVSHLIMEHALLFGDAVYSLGVCSSVLVSGPVCRLQE